VTKGAVIILLAIFCWGAGLGVAWVVWQGVMMLSDAWTGR
jgi:hypothetical protein